MWVSIDGVYSLYWWSRGFDALQIFRGANAIYCLPLYFALGFAMNVEIWRVKEVSSTAGLVRSCITCFQKHALHAVITCFFDALVRMWNLAGDFSHPVKLEALAVSCLRHLKCVIIRA